MPVALPLVGSTETMVPEMRAIQRQGYGRPYPVTIIREGEQAL